MTILQRPLRAMARAGGYILAIAMGIVIAYMLVGAFDMLPWPPD